MSLRSFPVVVEADLGSGHTTFPWDDHEGVGYWRCVDRISRSGLPGGLRFGSKYLHDLFGSAWNTSGSEPYTILEDLSVGPGQETMLPNPDLTTASGFYTGRTWSSVYAGSGSVGTLDSGSLGFSALEQENNRALPVKTTVAEVTQDRADNPRALAVTFTDTYRANDPTVRFGTPFASQDYTNVYQLVFSRNGDFEVNVGQVQVDASSYVIPDATPTVIGGQAAVLIAASIFLELVMPPILRGDGPEQMFQALTSFPSLTSAAHWTGYLPNQWGVSSALSTGLDPGASALPADVVLSPSAGPIYAGLVGDVPAFTELVVPAARISVTDYFDERSLASLGVHSDGGAHPLVDGSFNSSVPGRYFLRGWALVWPPVPPGTTVEPHLRMTQRNDGLGVAHHPRLRASQDGPSSVQRNPRARLGRNNRYR